MLQLVTYNQNYNQVQRHKDRTILYRRERRVGLGYYKQRAHWRKLGVLSVVAFHWLSCCSFSLAGQLPGKEKIFLLRPGVVR